MQINCTIDCLTFLKSAALQVLYVQYLTKSVNTKKSHKMTNTDRSNSFTHFPLNGDLCQTYVVMRKGRNWKLCKTSSLTLFLNLGKCILGGFIFFNDKHIEVKCQNVTIYENKSARTKSRTIPTDLCSFQGQSKRITQHQMFCLCLKPETMKHSRIFRNKILIHRVFAAMDCFHTRWGTNGRCVGYLNCKHWKLFIQFINPMFTLGSPCTCQRGAPNWWMGCLRKKRNNST